MVRKIAAVTFDLWDTLIQEHPGGSDKVAKIRVARIGSVLSSSGLPRDPREIMAAHERTGEFLGLVWAKRRDLSLTDQVLFMLDSIEAGIPGRLEAGDLARIEKAYSDSILENPPRLLPGALEALMHVKESGYRTGLISNTGRTPGSTLRPVMKSLGILRFFDTTTFSNEILVRKPAEGAFRTTLETLRAAPRAAVHVGDDPVSDIGGAKRAGMRSVQVLPDGREASPEADFAIRSLEAIPGVLERI